MLEYFKKILSKVSFDSMLFEKELKKALKALLEIEIEELRVWCYAQFIGQYPEILHRCFFLNRQTLQAAR